MKVVGFDPGYDEIGVACIEGSFSTKYRITKHEEIDIGSIVEAEKSRRKKCSWELWGFRMGLIRLEVLALLTVVRPDKVIIEMPGNWTRKDAGGRSVNHPQIIKLHEAFTTIFNACYEYFERNKPNGVETLSLIHLHDLSMAASRKAVATKRQAQENARAIEGGFGLKEHEADAAMLALYLARQE